MPPWPLWWLEPAPARTFTLGMSSLVYHCCSICIWISTSPVAWKDSTPEIFDCLKLHSVFGPCIPSGHCLRGLDSLAYSYCWLKQDSKYCEVIGCRSSVSAAPSYYITLNCTLV